MDKVSFKTRVRNVISDNAEGYKSYFVDYNYLIYSKKFKNHEYYIISAERDNYKHLTGVQSNLGAKEFFEKCMDKTISEDDFDFNRDSESEKIIKGSVRRKINVLPLMNSIFTPETLIEEDFQKNSIRCTFAVGSSNCTLGFILAGDCARPMTLLKGNEVNKDLSCEIDFVLRKLKTEKYFNEVVFGDKNAVAEFARDCKLVDGAILGNSK